MEAYSIERAGIRNLDFTGDLIGQSAGPTPRVKIYRTRGLRFVGELNAAQKMAQAQAFDKPADLIAWFKSQCPGTIISPEMQDAIEDATKLDESFKAVWNEHID